MNFAPTRDTDQPRADRSYVKGAITRNRSWVVFAAVWLTASAFTAFALPLDSPAWLVANTLIAVVSLLVTLLYGQRLPQGSRLFWYAIGGFQFFLVAGDLIFNTQSYLFGEPYGFSTADAFYFASYASGFAAVAVLIRKASPDKDGDAWVDSIIIALSGIALVSTFVVSRALTVNDAPMLDVAVAASYPLMDVVIFAALVRVISGRGRPNIALMLTAIAILVYAAADLLYNAAIVAVDWSGADRLMNFLFSVTVVLMASAVLSPDAGNVTDAVGERQRGESRRVIWLTLAIVIVPALLAYEVYTNPDNPGNRILAVISLLVILMVLWRVRGLLRTVEWQADQIASLARTDALTGLPNRRTLEYQLARFGDSRQRVAVAMLDLDHFKEYNDTHGHQHADELLTQTAQAWAGVITGPHLIARYGGEEFTAVIVDMPAAEVRALLEQARQAVPGDATVSIGYAMVRDGETLKDALARADAAMYQAKRTGRNRVIGYAADSHR